MLLRGVADRADFYGRTSICKCTVGWPISGSCKIFSDHFGFCEGVPDAHLHHDGLVRLVHYRDLARVVPAGRLHAPPQLRRLHRGDDGGRAMAGGVAMAGFVADGFSGSSFFSVDVRAPA